MISLLVSFFIQQQGSKLETVARSNIALLRDLFLSQHFLARREQHSGFSGYRRKTGDASEV